MTEIIETPEQLLARLERKATRVRADNKEIVGIVKALHRLNQSWTVIGKALGVSRQAAWRKYRGVTEDDQS